MLEIFSVRARIIRVKRVRIVHCVRIFLSEKVQNYSAVNVVPLFVSTITVEVQLNLLPRNLPFTHLALLIRVSHLRKLGIRWR